jgi:hypothetical protein
MVHVSSIIGGGGDEAPPPTEGGCLESMSCFLSREPAREAAGSLSGEPDFPELTNVADAGMSS